MNKKQPNRQILPPSERRVHITPEQIRSFLRPDNPGPYPMFATRKTEFATAWTIDIHHHFGGKKLTYVIRLSPRHKTATAARAAIEAKLASEGFHLLTPLLYVGNEFQCLTTTIGGMNLA